MLTYTSRWHDAIRTLAKLHSVDHTSVGLSDFGKAYGFYDRQIKTLGTISMSQAQALDTETGEPVGKIPYFDDMVAFFSDPKSQPKDRTTLVHGDYKIDNLVYHKTEPRVIGILE
jgi:aminoglycoside phosphotransferase (APT) family kinase protein